MAEAKKKGPQNGRELRRQATAEYEISSAPALALLDAACEALDLALAAEAQVQREGLTVQGRFGPRPHPAVNISRDARTRMIAALKSLHLDL